MIDVTQLWLKRFKFYIAEMRKYLRYIFNDHFTFVLVFAAGAGGYYYQKWLQSMSADFPVIFVLTILFAWILTQSPIRTFLQEADLVFLLPIETRLTTYFRKSLVYSIVFQCIILFIVVLIATPLYVQGHGKLTLLMFSFIIMMLVMAKAWNIFLSWVMLYHSDDWSFTSDKIIRFTVNVVFVFLLLSQSNLIYLLILLLMMSGLLVYFSKLSVGKALKWEKLIELDAKRMLMFYRVANLFTDVPKLKEQVKRRRWLNFLTKGIDFTQRSTFRYLYMKTFIRASDYFGVFARLLVIGWLLVYFIPFISGKLIIFVLFAYLAAFQLVPLYRHHHTKLWVDLYPIGTTSRHTAFLQVVFRLSVFQVLLSASAFFFLGQWLVGLLAIVLGLVFTYLYAYVYLKGRLSTFDQVGDGR